MPVGRSQRASLAGWALVALAVVAYLVIGLHQARNDAPTGDEGYEIATGVGAVVHRDLRMGPEHPPLPRVLSALPALLADPIVPKGDAWNEGDWFDWTDDFISANDRAGRLEDLLFFGRLASLAQGLAVAALLHHLTKRFFGSDAGKVVAVVWLTTPLVVGYAHLVLIDIPFTLVVLGVSALTIRVRESPTLGRAAALGAALGAGLSTRHTALAVVAVAVATVAWWGRRELRTTVRLLSVMALVTIAVTWAVYRTIDPSGPSEDVALRFEALISDQAAGSAMVKVGDSLPLPLEWRAGLAYLDLTSEPRPASLLGQRWSGSRWWYFPVSAIVKLPMTLVVGVLAGWALAVRYGRERRLLLATVVTPGIVMWALLLAQPLNLGLRLAMPSVALALVGVGGLVSATRVARRPLLTTALVVLVGVQFIAIADSAPHSLAWTPPPFRPAYRWMSDSNVDIGQATAEVRDWSQGRDALVAIHTSRGYHAPGTRRLEDAAPHEVTGWVAVGATTLAQADRRLSWLRRYCPVDSLGGGAVLIYRFEATPDMSPGPERPVGPCFDDRWSSDRS